MPKDVVILARYFDSASFMPNKGTVAKGKYLLISTG
jgi:hypothetical protein